MDQDSSEYIKGVTTYKRMLEQLHLYVCKHSNHANVEERTLLHRAKDWMDMEKLQGELYTDDDVCIVPFASGGNGQFAGNYTGWPQGLGKYNAHYMPLTTPLLQLLTLILSLAGCKSQSAQPQISRSFRK
jgi:hypothetical protein